MWSYRSRGSTPIDGQDSRGLESAAEASGDLIILIEDAFAYFQNAGVHGVSLLSGASIPIYSISNSRLWRISPL